MSTFKLSRPSSSAGGGEGWNKAEHLDHLHLFAGLELRTGIETSFGVSDAAHVDHVCCVDCPAVWPDQLVFGMALVPALTGDGEAEVVVGRLGQSLAKQGRNPAWLLDDPTEGDLAQAEAFLERYAARLPSGGIVLDVKAIEAARPDGGESF